MSFIRRLISATTPPTKLGRWHLHYDPNIVNSKVDQANEDHCGCCGESAEQMKQSEQMNQMKQMKQRDRKQKWQELQEKKQQALYAESEKYYIPYVM